MTPASADPSTRKVLIRASLPRFVAVSVESEGARLRFRATSSSAEARRSGFEDEAHRLSLGTAVEIDPVRLLDDVSPPSITNRLGR